MRWLALLFILCGCSVPEYPKDKETTTFSVSQAQIWDGDTILRVKMNNRYGRPYTGYSLRLARINTPELDEKGGIEARDFLRLVIKNGGGKITVPIIYKVDVYHRLVCEVEGNGLNVSDLMLKSGLAERF